MTWRLAGNICLSLDYGGGDGDGVGTITRGRAVQADSIKTRDESAYCFSA